jgi:hypothetical protein
MLLRKFLCRSTQTTKTSRGFVESILFTYERQSFVQEQNIHILQFCAKHFDVEVSHETFFLLL